MPEAIESCVKVLNDNQKPSAPQENRKSCQSVEKYVWWSDSIRRRLIVVECTYLVVDLLIYLCAIYALFMLNWCQLFELAKALAKQPSCQVAQLLSCRVVAVINTETPSEHVGSHLKRSQDLQSSISQVINHSIAYSFFFIMHVWPAWGGKLV